MKNIVFIAKTDLNTDGRILNQLKILEKYLNVNIDFILFPDKDLNTEFSNNITIHSVSTTFRNSSFFRLLTLLEFTFKAFFLLVRFKPKILHAQDSSILFPVLLYRVIRGRKFTLIYDDHEIPNENSSFFHSILNYIEVLVMKKSDFIIFANQERMEILKKRHSLVSNCSYFLNLPYFDIESLVDSEQIDSHLDFLDSEISKGTRFLIHQGVLFSERGSEKLADFSKILPPNYKILLLGGDKENFLRFVTQYHLDESKFYFRGSVNYLILPKYWERGIASIVMYLPTYINNRLCAPNRFYLSLEKGLPVIVNKNNPVLSNFIERYNCGFFIENLDQNNIAPIIESFNMGSGFFDTIKEIEIKNFISIYNKSLGIR